MGSELDQLVKNAEHRVWHRRRQLRELAALRDVLVGRRRDLLANPPQGNDAGAMVARLAELNVQAVAAEELVEALREALARAESELEMARHAAVTAGVVESA